MKRAGYMAAGVLILATGCSSYGPPAGDKFGQALRGDRPAADAAALLSADAGQRRWGTVQLARHGDPAAVDAILTRLDPRVEPVALNRAIAASALRTLGDARAAPELAKALNDPEPLVRADAARALGTLGGKVQTAALANTLARDADPAVRLEAVWALKNIGGEQAQTAIAAAVRDMDPSVAFAARSAAGTP